jgi:hypothetical protein
MVALFLFFKGMTGVLAPFSYLHDNNEYNNISSIAPKNGRKNDCYNDQKTILKNHHEITARFAIFTPRN